MNSFIVWYISVKASLIIKVLENWGVIPKSFTKEQYIENLQKQNKDLKIEWREEDLPIY